MQIFILEIVEHWFIIDNGKRVERTKRNFTAWANEDCVLEAIKEWLDKKAQSLDLDLLFAANSILQSAGISVEDKIFKIIRLFNRFSKFAAESNSKYDYKNCTWAEIGKYETKLRGSAFE